MAVSLQKGQRVSLSKDNAGLSNIMVGLGWDPVRQGGGLLSSLLNLAGSKADIDCDASVLMLDANDKIRSKSHVIYFGNTQSMCGNVKHMGDNLTGNGEGDDEQVLVNLERIPPEIQKLLFIVNIYDCINRRQDFGMIKNAFIRIIDMKGNKELIRFNLTEQYSRKTALMVGEIYRHDNEWKFLAIGEGTTEASLKEIIQRYS